MADETPPAPPAAAPTPEEQAAADKAALRAKRMANLLPPCRPGETRNREGKNGRTQQAALVRWLEEPSTDPKKTRIERVWEATYLAALKGSAPDRKTLIEQHGGKPKQALDLSSTDGSMSPNRKLTTAEARQELDRVIAAIEAPPVEQAPGQPAAQPAAEPAAPPVGGGEAPATEPKAEP